MTHKVLFVCLGNICRSPTAECIFRHQLQAENIAEEFKVDSAGTGAWHVGNPPDARMTIAAQQMGYKLQGKARQVTTQDFFDFDHIFAMDRSNLDTLRNLAPSEGTAALHLFRDFDPEGHGLDTPDPYYGGPEGFQEVVHIVFRTTSEMLQHLRSQP